MSYITIIYQSILRKKQRHKYTLFLFFYRLEEILVIVGVPVRPVDRLFLYGPDRHIGRRGRDLRLGLGVRLSKPIEDILRRGLGLGFGSDLDLLLENKAGPVGLLPDTLGGTNTLVVEMASFHATLMAEDVGAADFALGVADVMRATKLRGLSRILADLTECGLLGLLLGGCDTTGHSVGC